MTLEELEERRAARKAEAKAARDAQYLVDMEALDALEIELGDGMVEPLELQAHKAGLPTMVIVKCPDPKYYKRFTDMSRRNHKDAEQVGKAGDMLADQCVAYPDAETYKKVRDAFPGIHDSVTQAMMGLAQAKEKDRGK